MPHFICPNCKERSIDIDRKEGMFDEAVACHHCGFGFLFELMDDYYPAPATGMVVCDREGRHDVPCGPAGGDHDSRRRHQAAPRPPEAV